MKLIQIAGIQCPIQNNFISIIKTMVAQLTESIRHSVEMKMQERKVIFKSKECL